MLLQVKDLAHHFSKDSFHLDIGSIDFSSEDYCALVGANGSGKSLFASFLAGLLKPKSGTILIDGAPIAKNPQFIGQKIGIVFQSADSQIIGQSVQDDIRFGLINLGLKKEEQDRRIIDALQWSGLEDLKDQNPQVLSGGEKRRLAIASVLSMGPDILILDEPFSNLDFPGTQEVLLHINKVHEQGKGIIIISHSIEKFLAHCNRLILMKKGRIVADALPKRVLPFLLDHGVYNPNLKWEEMTWLDS
jgi:biotin transport system ATP-binding protein